VKVQASTFNGATIKIKEAANINKGIVKLKEEVKFWFPLHARFASTLHFRLFTSGSRIHYDHGVENWGGRRLNLYGSFGFSRDFDKYNGNVGVALLEKNATVDNRIRLDSENVVNWYHRTTARINDFRVGVIAVLNLTDKELIKKDLLLGYEKDNLDISVKAEQAFGHKTVDVGDWRDWFSKFTLTGVYRRAAKERYGIEVTANPKNDDVRATALVEYLYSDKGFTKIKLDTLLNLTLLVKKTMTERFALSFGALVPLQNKEKENKTKYGVQLDFNI